MEIIKLQDMLDRHINEADFNMYEDSIKGIIKLVIVATCQEYAYEFINIMMDDKRKEYTCDLFPTIINNTFYDFDLEESQNRYLIIMNLPTEAYDEEISEYIEECFNEAKKEFTDIICDYYSKDINNSFIRTYTHDLDVKVATLAITNSK